LRRDAELLVGMLEGQAGIETDVAAVPVGFAQPQHRQQHHHPGIGRDPISDQKLAGATNRG
jgi:hypothetical protein